MAIGGRGVENGSEEEGGGVERVRERERRDAVMAEQRGMPWVSTSALWSCMRLGRLKARRFNSGNGT